MAYAPELAILRLFTRDKSLVDKYKDTLDKVVLDTSLKMLYDLIKDYYAKYVHHNYCSYPEIRAMMLLKYSHYKDIGTLETILQSVYDLEVSDSLAKDIINAIIERDYATAIADTCLDIVGGSKVGVLLSIEDKLLAYKTYTDRESGESIFEETPLMDILMKYKPKDGTGLSWSLECLQDTLGPVTPGGFMHLVSRPESGKTSFLAQEIVNFAKQLPDGDCVLWCNNEEEGPRIRLRLFNSLMDMADSDLYENHEQAIHTYNTVIGERLRLISDKYSVQSIEQLRNYCKEFHPRILVIDHADKLSFSGSKHLDIPVRFRELYNKYRAIGKEFGCFVIAVGHASTEAEGKKWITMDYLDYSKTGKAAEVDVICGIGKTHNDEDENVRYLSFPKNKLTGKHSKLTLGFDSRKAKYSQL